VLESELYEEFQRCASRASSAFADPSPPSAMRQSRAQQFLKQLQARGIRYACVVETKIGNHGFSL
jgi:hypothetical protein